MANTNTTERAMAKKTKKAQQSIPGIDDPQLDMFKGQRDLFGGIESGADSLAKHVASTPTTNK